MRSHYGRRSQRPSDGFTCTNTQAPTRQTDPRPGRFSPEPARWCRPTRPSRRAGARQTHAASGGAVSTGLCRRQPRVISVGGTPLIDPARTCTTTRTVRRVGRIVENEQRGWCPRRTFRRRWPAPERRPGRDDLRHASGQPTETAAASPHQFERRTRPARNPVARSSPRWSVGARPLGTSASLRVRLASRPRSRGRQCGGVRSDAVRRRRRWPESVRHTRARRCPARAVLRPPPTSSTPDMFWEDRSPDRERGDGSGGGSALTAGPVAAAGQRIANARRMVTRPPRSRRAPPGPAAAVTLSRVWGRWPIRRARNPGARPLPRLSGVRAPRRLIPLPAGLRRSPASARLARPGAAR
jgi:hypothetical protein